MLRIYPVCIQLIRDLRPLADQIARFDRDHARQLRRSSMSIALNVAEGAGSRGGNRRVRYETALGSARETLANLEAAGAAGYVAGVTCELRGRFDHIIGTLVRCVAGGRGANAMARARGGDDCSRRLRRDAREGPSANGPASRALVRYGARAWVTALRNLRERPAPLKACSLMFHVERERHKLLTHARNVPTSKQ